MDALKIISGGQTGADQGALRAAKTKGFLTGGWAPKGWLTEDGPALWLADFGVAEYHQADYPARTKMCAANSDLLLWFGDTQSPGGKLSLRLAEEFDLPSRCVMFGVSEPADVAAWIQEQTAYWEGTISLWVAGNRESKAIGIGKRVEEFMGAVLDLLSA